MQGMRRAVPASGEGLPAKLTMPTHTQHMHSNRRTQLGGGTAPGAARGAMPSGDADAGCQVDYTRKRVQVAGQGCCWPGQELLPHTNRKSNARVKRGAHAIMWRVSLTRRRVAYKRMARPTDAHYRGGGCRPRLS